MLHCVKRHPVPIRAFFRHSLVLTYAFPRSVLEPLLPPGLELDTYGEFGFLAIAMVETEALRPAFLPSFVGKDFFLSGYRIFTRYRTPEGRTLRGLRILRSDTNKHVMACFGNLLTHYNYRVADVEVNESADALDIEIRTPGAEADLRVRARFDEADALPIGSPFPDWETARRYAGPLPFTFDYEPETHSIVRIEGVRSGWKPRAVHVDVMRCTFVERAPFRDAPPRLANAFLVSRIPYMWRRGIVARLPDEHLEARTA